jgi:hypothetical protein
MRLLVIVVATATLAVLTAACGDSPASPAEDILSPTLAKGGVPGAPPGDDPAPKDIPVQLSANYGGIYEESCDVLIGDIELGGRFWMSLNPKRNETDPPKLCVALPDPTVVHPEAVDHWAEFLDLAGPIGIPFCIPDFAIHTREEGEPGLYDMLTGATVTAGGKIALDEFSTKDGTWEWRLIWDTSSGNPDQSEYGLGVCVTRIDSGTWRVHNECDDLGVDTDIELWRVSREVGWKHVADFDMPFSFTLTEVP